MGCGVVMDKKRIERKREGAERDASKEAKVEAIDESDESDE